MRTTHEVTSSDSEITEKIPHRVNPAIAQLATEERATHEVFKLYPSRITINKLRPCTLEYRLPCGSRVMVPSPDSTRPSHRRGS